jgi:S-adenosylmethionine synthetase
VGLIGELTTSAQIDFEKIARQTIAKIGYNSDELGFNSQTCKIQTFIGKQSSEINSAVVQSEDVGAGDQGIMFGFACKQTESLMPLPIFLAHQLALKIETVRQSLEAKKDFSLRPDAKTQVSIQYNSNQEIEAIDTILISSQHSPDISQEKLRELLIELVILPTIVEYNLEKYYSNDTKILTNPSGSFVLGGPVADSGLTGRKIIVDSYGGWARSGGGAFSGKDGSKVDRSGSYMARFVAKNIVAKGLADSVEIQISYAIGQSKPVSLAFFGKLNQTQEEIEKYVLENFDFRPKAIIQRLGLNKPIFAPTASYGHFGREAHGDFFTWEKIV